MKHLISPKPLRAMALIAVLALSAMTAPALESTTVSGAPATAPASPNTPQLSFGVPDVLKLSNAKVNEDTILSYVQYSGLSYGALSAVEIVYLHDQGVSDRVVTAMLEQRKKFAETAAQTAQQAAVASAPQYVQAPAPSTVNYVQSAPASTVHVIPYSPRYVDYGYSYPWYGYYGYTYPVSLSFGYYGGYRGYCGSGYYGGYRGGSYCGRGYYGGGYRGGGYHGGGGGYRGGHHR